MNYKGIECDSVREGQARNGKPAKVFLFKKGKLVATSCCNCNQIKIVEDMTPSNIKNFGVDSRCKICEKLRKSRKKYKRINFEKEINDYFKFTLAGTNRDKFSVVRGFPKNGYSRVVIKRFDEIYALSCCSCFKIKSSIFFNKINKKHSQFGYRGDCIFCERENRKKDKIYED
ncbi:hypothetical protein C0L75_03290 [Clostridium perfringens]